MFRLDYGFLLIVLPLTDNDGHLLPPFHVTRGKLHKSLYFKPFDNPWKQLFDKENLLITCTLCIRLVKASVRKRLEDCEKAVGK